MDPRRVQEPYDTIRAGFDGLFRFDLERRAGLAESRGPDARAGSPGSARTHAAILGSILVHLRRTRSETYKAAEHAAYARIAEHIDPDLAEHLRAAGHPVGSCIAVVGEQAAGIVTQVLVARETDGAYARWYVVHLPGLRICRAYGCDELEATRPSPDRAPSPIRTRDPRQTVRAH